jgi:YqaJ-like viral recombinase domain
MKIHTMVQYSGDWWTVRSGKATASEFDQIITPAKGEPSKSRFKYAARVAAEKLFGCHPNWFTERPMNPAQRHGLEYESEARAWYALESGLSVQMVGFCESECGRYGCSPDGLISRVTNDVSEMSALALESGASEELIRVGALELKCPDPGTHAEYLSDPESLEQDYRPQTHGHLLVTGLPWVDLVSYCPPMPGLIRRIVPGEYTAKLAEQLEAFLELVAEAERRLRPQPVGVR